MRNLFGMHRTKEDLKAIADAKPKGVHHTIKFTSSYNETWEHIWKETKKIGLSGNKDRCFISEERFSYDAKMQTKRSSADSRDTVAQNQMILNKAYRKEKILLLPFVYKQNGLDSATQYLRDAEMVEVKADKVELEAQSKQLCAKAEDHKEWTGDKELSKASDPLDKYLEKIESNPYTFYEELNVTVGSGKATDEVNHEKDIVLITEPQDADIFSEEIKLLSWEQVPAFITHERGPIQRNRKIRSHSTEGGNVSGSAIQKGETEALLKENELPSLFNDTENLPENTKENIPQKQDQDIVFEYSC